MRVHERVSFQYRENVVSNAATAAMEEARGFARQLEGRERDRLIQGGYEFAAGKSPTERAREILAHQAGITPSTWRNLTVGRLKRLDAWLRDRLHQMVIHELEAEFKRLQHELEILRQRGARADSDQVREVEAHLACAKTILNGGRG